MDLSIVFLREIVDPPSHAPATARANQRDRPKVTTSLRGGQSPTWQSPAGMREIATPLRARNDVEILGWSCCFSAAGIDGFSRPAGAVGRRGRRPLRESRTHSVGAGVLDGPVIWAAGTNHIAVRR